MKDLLVVTTLFDYFDSKYMRSNYDKFREQIEREGVDLVVFEAAVEGQPFRLSESPNVVQLRSRDMIWQKERMINLAIEKFSEDYENVAWIDNDVILPDGWSVKAKEMMARFPVGQLFSCIDYLMPDGSIDKVVPGYVKNLHSRGYEILLDTSLMGNPGTAWIARSSVVRKAGIYDAYINCGSDTLWSITVGGERKGWVIKLKKSPRSYNVLMNKFLSRHHSEWHQKFVKHLKDLVGDDVREWTGFLDSPVSHLYHGSLASRNYMDRHWILADDDFDPAEDMKLNEDGLYEWASDKPRMHKKLKKIFRQGDRFIAYT